MPSRIPSACRQPGCPTPGDRGWCAAHLPEGRNREYGERRKQSPGQFVAFYGSQAWRELRDAHIARHPFCVHCELKGKHRLGKEVDHIVELEDGGAPLEPANLQTLCFPCHRTKTQLARQAREGRGGSMSGAIAAPSGRPASRVVPGNSEGGGFGGSGGSA